MNVLGSSHFKSIPVTGGQTLAGPMIKASTLYQDVSGFRERKPMPAQPCMNQAWGVWGLGFRGKALNAAT